MKVSAKLDLISEIGRELQKRYSYHDIDVFLEGFDVAPPQNFSANSKWLYTKVALQSASEATLSLIAAELDLPGITSAGIVPLPRNWQETKLFRLFISHISKDKAKATRLKDCLAPYGILGFVAHEDIHPTLEWQTEIERALRHMDAFIAVLTAGFSKSEWTQQEVGFAVGRGTKIISFKMGEGPTGFISKQQALARRDRPAEEIAKEIDALLASDEATKSRLSEAKATLPRKSAFEDDFDDVPF
jgi:hypothetical protein